MIASQSEAVAQSFVPLRAGHRMLLKVSLLILFAVALLPILLAQSLPVFALYFATLLLLVVRALPLLYNRSQLGLFHPVVFFSALWLLRSLPSIFSDAYRVFFYGPASVVLDHHDALVGLSSDKLNWLMAGSVYLAVLGTIAYYGGFWLGPKVNLPRVQFRVVKLPLVKIFLAVIASVLLFSWFIVERGGVVAHFMSWQEGRFSALEGDGFLLHAINITTLACLIWFAVSRTAIRRGAFWLCVVAALATKFIATGSRSEVIYYLVLGALVWMLREKKIIPGRAIVLIAFAFALFGALGSFRGAITGQGLLELDRLTDVRGAFERAFGIEEASGELSSRGGRQNGILPILYHVPESEPLLLGESYFNLLTLPIPRALWPDKPRSIGAAVNEKFFTYSTEFSIPPGAVGEAFWNFHIPGVVVVFFIFGAFHRALCRWYIENGSHRAALLLYVMTLFLFSAPDSLSAAKWIFSTLPLIALLWWCGYLRFSSKALR